MNIPFRAIIFFAIPAILLLVYVFPKMNAKRCGFFTRFLAGTGILGICFSASPYSLLLWDGLAAWLLADTTDGMAEKASRRVEITKEYIASINFGYLWQAAAAVSMVLSIVYLIHLILKKRGISWKNL